MKKSDIVVIIPAFNESAYIAAVLHAVKKTGFRFLVVDDGSTDDTAKIAKHYCDHVLVHRVNLGKGLSSMDIFFPDYK
jgi:glycosyltransferase involved in cell wall biosynthesis